MMISRWLALAACLCLTACKEKPTLTDNWSEICAIRSCDKLRSGYRYIEMDSFLYELPEDARISDVRGAKFFSELNAEGKATRMLYLDTSRVYLHVRVGVISQDMKNGADDYGAIRVELTSRKNPASFKEIDGTADRITSSSSTERWSEAFRILSKDSSHNNPDTDTQKLKLVSNGPLAFGRRGYLECYRFCSVQLLRGEDSEDPWPLIWVTGFRVASLPDCEADSMGCLSQREHIDRIPERMQALEAMLRGMRLP